MEILGGLEEYSDDSHRGWMVAECYSSSFISSSHLICAFVSSPAPSVSSVSSIMMVMLAFELTMYEITDNISLDFTDQDLIVNWNSTGKRNKKPPWVQWEPIAAFFKLLVLICQLLPCSPLLYHCSQMCQWIWEICKSCKVNFCSKTEEKRTKGSFKSLSSFRHMPW